MTTQTIERQKLEYSRQLAAYTFRQWNAACESKLSERRENPSGAGKKDHKTRTPEKQGLNTSNKEEGPV
ncbi:hypothetical protein Hypma_015235 [Hypsizygus marmoreus]|uniref:Uncharacterized protein n=1 Tax=Hypsizygus marmoreus TaxID=39966 RepID=A0A369K4W1_HYPMA|nr:hypothetical protein Hypma_015235 [Hypsizygus marmoreus]